MSEELGIFDFDEEDELDKQIDEMLGDEDKFEEEILLDIWNDDEDSEED